VKKLNNVKTYVKPASCTTQSSIDQTFGSSLSHLLHVRAKNTLTVLVTAFIGREILSFI